jgi:hypothetical protein
MTTPLEDMIANRGGSTPDSKSREIITANLRRLANSGEPILPDNLKHLEEPQVVDLRHLAAEGIESALHEELERRKGRKFSEQECEEAGGHFWKEWEHNDVVDDNFNKQPFRHLLAFIGPEPRYRGCPLCGKTQRLVPSRWEDTN